MNKKITLGLVAVLTIIGGVAAMSAYEAHVINVTAHIENALRIYPIGQELEFGTVFPQEYRTEQITITTSESFCASTQRRVLNIDYKIVQKPKCVNTDGQHVPVQSWDDECPAGYTKMTSLCPYLSKTPKKIDPSPYTDYGVPAFHDPATAVATGRINKDHDLTDDWIIDLPTPCFRGYCSQDWDEFVHSHNPTADPKLYELVGDPNGTDLGCDLWVEATRIY